MSITRHPIFWDLRPFVRPDGVGPVRIDLPRDLILRAAFLNVIQPCVSCGRSLRPIRRVEGGYALEYNAACLLSWVCQWSVEAADEYAWVRTVAMTWRLEQARSAAMARVM